MSSKSIENNTFEIAMWWILYLLNRIHIVSTSINNSNSNRFFCQLRVSIKFIFAFYYQKFERNSGKFQYEHYIQLDWPRLLARRRDKSIERDCNRLQQLRRCGLMSNQIRLRRDYFNEDHFDFKRGDHSD